jgi:hypothetical protein
MELQTEATLSLSLVLPQVQLVTVLDVPEEYLKSEMEELEVGSS